MSTAEDLGLEVRPNRPVRTRPLPVLLVDARGAAAMLGVSPRHLASLVRDGLVPPPRRLGKKATRWSVQSLEKWAAQGCPPAATWKP